MISPRTDRKAILIAGSLSLCLLATAAWFYGYLADSYAVAQAAADDAARCVQLAVEIRDLQQQPSLAQLQELQLQELTQRIERAAQQSNITLENLIRIWPEPAKRVGDTPYKRKPTQVLFHSVTLPELVGFLQQLSTQDAGPQVTRIRLTAPHDEETGDRWSAEVTLTYLIYAPKITTNDRPEFDGHL